jgi:hypothetical protein
MEIFKRSMQQECWKGTNIRRSRAGIVRNTYPQLKSTTIKTWQDWFPDEVSHIVWGSPITSDFILPLPDGTTIHCEILFVPLDKPKDVDKLLSMELSFAWINEAKQVPKTILDNLLLCVGRYPPKKFGGATWAGLMMDTNPPDSDHWYYNLAEEVKPPKYQFWRQPPAILRTKDGQYVPNTGQMKGIPPAENVINHVLGYDYWMNQVPGKAQEWIKVWLQGEYGTSEEGKPVYANYNDEFHCAKKDLEPYRGLPLILGFDFGLTPACVIAQLTPKGQLRIIDELCAVSSGIKRFVRDALKPHLANNYGGMSVQAYCDPAGNSRVETDEQTCIQILQGFSIPVQPAHTNNLIPRMEAVDHYLLGNVDGEPALLVSPKARMIRKGFMGAYKFERVQIIGKEMYRDAPAKNPYSHPHDGLQALCLGVNKTEHVTTGHGSAQAREVQKRKGA